MKLPLCLCSVFVLLLAPFTFAQSGPTHEVSVGYSFLGSNVETDRNGWVASFSERVHDRLWVKAEAGGNYRKTFFFDSNRPNYVHSILAGPEFKLRKDTKLVPWAHFLVGVAMNTHPILTFPVGTGPIFHKTDVHFGFQPGGGIDYHLNPRLAIRIGADYRRVTDVTFRNYFRLQSGLVFGFGEQ